MLDIFQRDFRLHTNANLLHTVKLVICYSCDVSKMGGFADWSFCSFVVQPANVVLHIVHILQTVNMQNTPQVKGIDAQRCLFCKMLRSNDGEWFWNKGRQLHWCSLMYLCTIFSQGVGYITSSQWFRRKFECNRFPGHQVWILNATNFLKNWETSRSRLAMPFNKWLQSVSVTSRVYCSNPAVTLW